MSDTIENLLAQQTEAAITNYNRAVSSAIIEAGGDEEVGLKNIESKAYTPTDEEAEAFTNAIINFADKCKFNETTEKFEGYDSDGSISAECREALMTYANLLNKFLTV